MNNLEINEIYSYEYPFGEIDDISINIIGYKNTTIEPYIKVYKKGQCSNDISKMCRLSIISSKYIGLQDETLKLDYIDICNIYKIIKESPFNVFAMFAHTQEEDLNPYLSDDEIDELLEKYYRISNRNYNKFSIPNYFSLLIYNISSDQTFGNNTITLT